MTALYRDFLTREELDAAYDNTRAVADSARILVGFEERSRLLAERYPGELNLRFGPRERQRIDFFRAGSPGAPLLVFIHGGYWQMRRKETFRFLAAGAYDPYSRGRDGIVRHLFEELGMRVVKFEVSTGSGLMATHPVFGLDGEVMEREAAFADEHGLVFVIDIGKLGSPSSQIGALRRLIRRHAGMKFVVCHLLAPKHSEMEEMAAGLEALAGPNVWFDLASLQHNVRPDAPPYPVTRRFIAKARRLKGSCRAFAVKGSPRIPASG